MTSSSASERARWHHAIPRSYLRGWSLDGRTVQARRLLVPVATYPEWSAQAIRSLTVVPDLYTSVLAGKASDEFERWLNTNVETPAAEALDRVRRDLPLGRDDWQRLALYVAALDVRTLRSYQEQTERWEKTLKPILDSTLRNIPKKIAQHAPPPRRSRDRTPSQRPVPPVGARFPLRITTTPSADGDGVVLRADVTLGRELWLHSMRHQLSTTAEVLTHHRWWILHPHPGSQWFTSDDPVIRLNYYGDGQYDLKGGWGRRGGEILVPLSPSAMLYTKIGDRSPRTAELSAKMTITFQRLVAEHAHRWIVACDRPQRALWFRPRVVSRELFAAEERLAADWHDAQTAAERGDAGPGTGEAVPPP